MGESLEISEWSSKSRARWFMTGLLHVLSMLLVILTAPFSLFFSLKRCQEYERAVVLGSTLERATIRGPGLVFILPFLEHAEIIDIRTKVFEVPSQQILTTDSVTLTVDVNEDCRQIQSFHLVFDPVKAATGAMDYNAAVRGLASSTLGGILGTYQLGSLLAERAEIAEKVLNIFKVDCDPWGVHVERVEVKSLVVAREMIVPMAKEAKAAREAEGLSILQRGEKNCLQKIRVAADEMTDNPTSITLKYLQVLNNISTKNNRTVVVPLPKSLLLTDKIENDD